MPQKRGSTVATGKAFICIPQPDGLPKYLAATNSSIKLYFPEVYAAIQSDIAAKIVDSMQKSTKHLIFPPASPPEVFESIETA